VIGGELHSFGDVHVVEEAGLGGGAVGEKDALALLIGAEDILDGFGHDVSRGVTHEEECVGGCGLVGAGGGDDGDGGIAIDERGEVAELGALAVVEVDLGADGGLGEAGADGGGDGLRGDGGVEGLDGVVGKGDAGHGVLSCDA
jgi:hypothetical protein